MPTEPVPILQTYLAIRRVATGSIPMLVVCDKALAGKLTSAVQENLVKTGLADSVVIDFACQGVKGEIRGNKYRQSLRITRMRIDPGVLVTFEAIAFTGFGQYHMEEYIHDEKDRKKTRLVLGDFISS